LQQLSANPNKHSKLSSTLESKVMQWYEQAMNGK
jgi:hypothetical protein